MIFDKETSAKVAEFLLRIKAVEINVKEPFEWSSGIKSPIYCDNRKVLSFPKIRTFIRQSFSEAINENFGKPDIIAGVATGGIAPGALVAQDLGLPFVYVRPEHKDHGKKNQIEGYIESGRSVVVLEDLISTGSSGIAAVNAVKDAGCIVKGMVATFTYNLSEAQDNFKKEKCKLVTLTDYDILTKQAVKYNYINEKELKKLRSWTDSMEAVD
ncbi:MAG: orotate phosphoribosyltransferase [Flavobacteriales bacterium]